jgi:CRISPR-associated protein Cas2
MQGARWWLVCYDVRDPKRLRQAAKKVEGYGTRLQYSVFRAWLTIRQMQQLRWELTELLLPEDDVIMIPLCSDCVAGIQATYAKEKGIDWPEAPGKPRIV